MCVFESVSCIYTHVNDVDKLVINFWVHATGVSQITATQYMFTVKPCYHAEDLGQVSAQSTLINKFLYICVAQTVMWS